MITGLNPRAEIEMDRFALDPQEDQEHYIVGKELFG